MRYGLISSNPQIAGKKIILLGSGPKKTGHQP
jgi:hypothetical protein